MSRMPRVVIAVLLALCLTSGCQFVWDVVRHARHADPDTWIFAGDPRAFLDKEVIIQFRETGDPRMYKQFINCILLGVEQDHIIVRGLRMDDPVGKAQYVRLLELGKLILVEGQPGVFRIHRNDINHIFEFKLPPNQ